MSTDRRGRSLCCRAWTMRQQYLRNNSSKITMTEEVFGKNARIDAQSSLEAAPRNVVAGIKNRNEKSVDASF